MFYQIRDWNTNVTIGHAIPDACPGLCPSGMPMRATLTHIMPLPKDGLQATVRQSLGPGRRSGGDLKTRLFAYAPVG
eukprot:9722261-Alexandrium_andersonii.AAC.1